MDKTEETKSRWNHSDDDTNKDIELIVHTQEWYEERMNFESALPDPVIKCYPQEDGRRLYVAQEDLLEPGLKGRAAELVVRDCPKDTLVYVAMRKGHAPQAIAYLAKKYNKKLVVFCPASKRMSVDQIKPKKYLGDNCDIRFVRIAASPVLNKYAKDWADEHNAFFIPFGFSGVKPVSAGIARASRLYLREVKKQYGNIPSQVWCVYSTGTMGRALQIGLGHLDIEFHGSAVARNMKKGETGKSKMWKEERAFFTDVKDHEKPPFPCVANYDAKLWVQFVENAKDGALFINVSKDATPEEIEEYEALIDTHYPKSAREWGDKSDLESGPIWNE